MRNTNSEITVPLDDTSAAASTLGIAEIRAVMQGCRNDSLTAAERELMAARDAMADLRGRERSIIQALNKSDRARSAAERELAGFGEELPALAREIEAAEAIVGDRRRDLDAERERLVGRLRRALKNDFNRALVKLAAGLALVDEAEAVFSAIDAFAARNGIETPLRLPRRIGAEDVARDIARRLAPEAK
jgi:hypothetical protein